MAAGEIIAITNLPPSRVDAFLPEGAIDEFTGMDAEERAEVIRTLTASLSRSLDGAAVLFQETSRAAGEVANGVPKVVKGIVVFFDNGTMVVRELGAEGVKYVQAQTELVKAIAADPNARAEAGGRFGKWFGITLAAGTTLAALGALLLLGSGRKSGDYN